jgi:hypothetical protein
MEGKWVYRTPTLGGIFRGPICAELDLEEQRLEACTYRLEAARLPARVTLLEGRVTRP